MEIGFVILGGFVLVRVLAHVRTRRSRTGSAAVHDAVHAALPPSPAALAPAALAPAALAPAPPVALLPAPRAAGSAEAVGSASTAGSPADGGPVRVRARHLAS